MSIPRAAAALIVGVLVLFCGGCLDATTTVDLRPDGSGTVTETVFVAKPMQRMLGVVSSVAASMMQVGAATNATAAPPAADDRARYTARAAAMGPGVRLESIGKATRRDGLAGVQAVYAFADVRNLRIPVDPPYPVPDFGQAPTAETARVTFAYTPGAQPVLIASVPWAQAARQAVADRQAARPATPVSEEEYAMLRHVLDGFRTRLLIGSETGVSSTSAAFAEATADRDARRRVVLYDLDLGTLARNASLLEQLASIGPARDMGDALSRYAGLPGLKVEMQPQVTIRF